MKEITVTRKVAGQSFAITLTQIRTTIWDWEASVDGTFYASGSMPSSSQQSAINAITWELYDLVMAEQEESVDA